MISTNVKWFHQFNRIAVNLVLLNQESFGLFCLARFLKLIIATQQHSTEICNACHYWSVLVVYCMEIIRLNHFRIEICGFYCGACHCFCHYTDVFYCMFLIIYWGMIFYECIWLHLTVSETDIIKVFYQLNVHTMIVIFHHRRHCNRHRHHRHYGNHFTHRRPST